MSERVCNERECVSLFTEAFIVPTVVCFLLGKLYVGTEKKESLVVPIVY
jgi:hypothetical protein